MILGEGSEHESTPDITGRKAREQLKLQGGTPMNFVLTRSAISIFSLAAAFYGSTPVLADTILVDAVGAVQWKAENCSSCTQIENSVEIAVEPGDIIVFRQASFLEHGVKAANDNEAKKIQKREQDEDNAQIVVELGDGPTKIGPGIKFPGATGDPVEMTRIEVKDNFEGSLVLWCTEHDESMTITLKKD